MHGIRPKGVTKIHLVNANLPLDYYESDFSNYEGGPLAKTQAIAYLDNLRDNKHKGVGLLFAGKPGVGKTTIVCILLKYLLRANWSCYMTSLSELIEEIKRSWSTSDTSHIDMCKRMEFLGLDDVGKEHEGPTGFSSVTFDNLLRYRIQQRRPTFFTTNLNKKQMHSRYGDATVSLIEGKTIIVPVISEDFRQSQKRDLSY